MTKTLCMLAAALALPLTGHSAATAEESLTPAVAHKAEWPEGVTDASSLSWVIEDRSNAIARAKWTLMDQLFQAHLATKHQSREQVGRRLADASQQLQSLVEEGLEGAPSKVAGPVKLVELKYGSIISPNLIYVPVADSTLAIDDFVAVLDIKAADRSDIEGAKVRYVRLQLDPDKLSHDLNEGLEALNMGDLDGVRDQLVDAQQSMITELERAPSLQGVARDNVSLARFLLKAAEYEGAREALKEAERAVAALCEGQDASDRDAAEVETIRKEMRELSGMIEQRDPALADQIDKQLEAWWNSLS
ncbi:hypothetical protein [Kordiimonas lacus]|uniref:YfdX protein n=1 Tax=Kordiimonas lacus TaxID=637679 RepID=A0A1G6YB44_9PROT|nr:hypothetical protein [Kordiimonas lacus]SDD86795.1 hypothetical protein SAMN04488071_1531 [Kordiimonas lacus]